MPPDTNLARAALPGTEAGHLDLVILGGGCAGLSLATRLAALGDRAPRTLVLERRATYADDRTWCFWDDGTAPAAHLARRRWTAMTLAAAGRRITIDCAATPYHMLQALPFYSDAAATIARSRRVALAQGVAVLDTPRRNGALWRIETAAGPRHATQVIDTRPGPPPARGGAMLWQSFHGREVECSADAFDPALPELMDFAAPCPQAVRFTYVLPLSPRRALVEATVFGAEPLGPDALAAELDAAILQRTGPAPVRVIRSENGILPMGPTPATQATDPSYVRAGLMAGGARPSTGYAFQRIQRWADACAAALRDGRPPLAHPADGPLVHTMDRLLLTVLRANPEAGPALFLSLFARADTARIIRFLSDRATFADLFAIIFALPPTPFLRALPGAVLRGLR